MKTNNFKNTIEPLYNKLWNSYKDQKTNDDLNYRLFMPQWGSQYPEEKNTGILVIGKATYGWRDIKNHNNLFDPENKLFLHTEEQMQWVLDSRKNKKNDKKYNSNRSAFWRLSEAITKQLTNDPSNNWIKHLAWSNLYKVAAKKGNPNQKTKDQQFDLCQQILHAEIDFFSPKYIIFLTSGWEKPFLKNLNNNHASEPIAEIQWGKKKKYKTYAYRFNQRLWVISHHPQSKPEYLHFQAIIKLITDIEG